MIRIQKTSPHFILGKGKVEEIIQQLNKFDADVLIFDNEISPAQQRNWETESKILVIDRHEIILDVFAEGLKPKLAPIKASPFRVFIAETEKSMEPPWSTTGWWSEPKG